MIDVQKAYADIQDKFISFNQSRCSYLLRVQMNNPFIDYVKPIADGIVRGGYLMKENKPMFKILIK